MKKWLLFFLIIYLFVGASTAYSYYPFDTQKLDKVNECQDVRGCDLSTLAVDDTLLKTLSFNQDTIWSSTSASSASTTMEIGKDPGLGIRKLHIQGLTGKGVSVGVIDQRLALDHPEYKGKVVQYKSWCEEQPYSMHGPAVVSLLAGSSIGTAPGASIYYGAVPSGTQNAHYYAESLNWMVGLNAELPVERRIRVVSVSAAPDDVGWLNRIEWIDALVLAKRNGVAVIDCSTDKIFWAGQYGSDRQDPIKCTPGYPSVSTPWSRIKNKLIIPVGQRTLAEVYASGEYGYWYDGRGGMSWAPPYLAGVLAIGWQICPQMSKEKAMELLLNSAHKRDGLSFANPVEFIKLVKQQ